VGPGVSSMPPGKGAARVVFAYAALVKLRIVALVLVTCSMGLLAASSGHTPRALAFCALLGTGLLAGGACALNQYLERDADGLMERTRRRPLPAGLISEGGALTFGVCLVLAGSAVLLWRTNALTAFLGILSAFLYVLVYTPMKRVTWVNTSIGAIPGALPPLMGWAAVDGRLAPPAWLLFAIVFLWQHVHFNAIAWIFRDDYRRAGFRMLPVVQPSGKGTFDQILIAAAALLPLSLLAVDLQRACAACRWASLALGLGILAMGAWGRRNRESASAIARASVFYLPFLFGLMFAGLLG
jgi:protoheme IX farnesyltransferase